MSQSDNTLIYIGDPMCSWCYGFAPEIAKAKDALDDELDFQLVMGGLRPYNTQTMPELKEFLGHHWEEVSKASGQIFNHAILNDPTFVYDTEPPCRAVRVIRTIKPEAEFAFFKAVQKAFYFDNKNTNDVESYYPLVEEIGVEPEEFRKWFETEDMKEKVRKDFEFSGEMGIQGFPSVVLKKGEEYFLVANGYTTSEKLVKTVRSVLKEKAKN